jgi:antitoxin component of MazEF toxin-antitoxin module
MIQQQLRKAGNSYVITIPKDEVERNGWSVGDRFAVQLTLLEERPVLSPELREALDASWKTHEAAYRYLAQ